jgi:hypothetical protein
MCGDYGDEGLEIFANSIFGEDWRISSTSFSVARILTWKLRFCFSS